MDEQRIRQIIQEELNNYAIRNQYAVSRIPAHNHDGLGSIKVDANNLDYGLPFFKVFQSSTTPTVGPAGAIASLNSTLYISNGTTWIKVGGQ